MADDLILIDDRGNILFFGRPIGSISRGVATVDEACFFREINSFLMPRCRKISWQPGIADKLAQEELIANAHRIKKVRVYQLKPEVDPVMRFIGYAELVAKHGGVQRLEYHIVYDDDCGTDDAEAVYRVLRDSQPHGFTGHTLTRSDVLELYSPTSSRFFYVDTFALVPVKFE